MEDVIIFLGLWQKDLEDKPKELYHSKYVNYVRVCRQQDASSFLHAEVRAEMKLHLTYKVDIHFAAHTVHECQCECAAGMGPDAHCKHVACVLFGITQFCKTRQFLTLTTCTDELQSFHRVKKHLGSPIKSENLILHNNKLHTADFDPRPPVMRCNPQYGPYFYSIVVNSGVFRDAPIMQIIPPANPYAITQDHDYLHETPETTFLKQFGLQDISDEYVQCTERKTVADKKLWREERRKRLCSSDFGNVCKLTERSNKVKLCDRLISGKEVRTPALLHGKKHEHAALQKYAELTQSKPDSCGLFVSKSKPFLASTPDGQICKDILIEVKCPYSACGKNISPLTVPFLEIKDGNLSLKTNHDYFYQVQGQMFCVGDRIRSVHFVVFTLSDISIIHIQRDDEFIAKMVEKLESFYLNHYKEAVLEKYMYKNYSKHFS